VIRWTTAQAGPGLPTTLQGIALEATDEVRSVEGMEKTERVQGVLLLETIGLPIGPVEAFAYVC
jgi:hypothetical protein